MMWCDWKIGDMVLHNVISTITEIDHEYEFVYIKPDKGDDKQIKKVHMSMLVWVCRPKLVGHLVAERMAWNAMYRDGHKPDFPPFNEYIKNRDSNHWRMARIMEEMCEYIRFLESELNERV